MELTDTGNDCPGCVADGYEEFCGHCPECWKNLDPEERAVLQGNEPPVKEIVTHKQVVTHYPPPPWIVWRICFIAWNMAIGAALGWLMFRAH